MSLDLSVERLIAGAPERVFDAFTDDLVVSGGARIAHSLMRHRLIDEYRLTVHPVALGEGLPLMHGLPEPQSLDLVSSTAYADGCVTQVFRPA